MNDVNINAVVLNTYAQALLIARSKGMRGEDARYVALKATSGSVSKKAGYPIDVNEIRRIIQTYGTDDEAA